MRMSVSDPLLPVLDLAKEFGFSEEEDFPTLTESAHNKFSSYVTIRQTKIYHLKAKVKYLKVRHEQELVEYQNKCQTLDEELQSLRQNYAENKRREEDQTSSLSKLEERVREYRAQIDAFSEEKTTLDHNIRTLQGENVYLTDQLKRETQKCESIESELQALKKEVGDFRTEKFRLQLRQQELEEQENSIKIREMRCTSERERMEQLVEALEKQLRERNDMLSSVRHECNKKTITLENELQSKVDELATALDLNSTLKEKAERLQQSADTYIQRIKILQEEQISQEELHSQEVAPLKRLVDIQREKADYFEKKTDELQSALTELKHVFEKAKEDYYKAEAEKQIQLEQLNSDLESARRTISNLQRELADANVLLDKFRVKGVSEEELRQMNPAVASVIHKLKTSRSLTQIYSEYVQVVEERDLLQVEVRRLSDYLTEIMHQLEEKGPAIRRQREDCLHYQECVNKLSQQLNDMMQEMNRLDEESSRQKRKCDFYQKDALMWKSQSEDLSKQLRVVLGELEMARGNLVQTEADSSADKATSDNSAANQVITSNLLTFRSISELQQQNQRLLHLTRSLASQLEEREANDQTEKVTSLSKQLENIQEEMESLRRMHERQRTQMELVQRQRDMYKVLLHEHDREDQEFGRKTLTNLTVDDVETHSPERPTAGGPSEKNTTPVTTPRKHLEETATALKELQKEFQQYREDKLASDKVYQDTVEQLRTENSTLRLQNAKVLSQLDFSHEKFKTLESHVVSYKNEVKMLRDMKVQQTARLQQLESDNTRLQRELADLTHRNSSLQVEVATLQSRTRSLQEQDRRQREDLEMAHAQRRQQQELAHHLQTIHSKLEQRDSTEKQQLRHQHETLTQECASLRSQVTLLRSENKQSEEQLRKAREHLTKERDLRLAVEKLMAEMRRMQDDSQHAMHMRQDVAVQTDSVKGGEFAALYTSQPTVSADSTEDDSFSVFSLKLKVKELEGEKQASSQRQERLLQQYEEYRRLCSDLEQQLSEQAEELKRMESELAEKLVKAQERSEYLLQQLSVVEDQCKSSIDENYKVTEEAHALNAELRKQLAQAQHELQEAIQRRDAAIMIESTAKDTIAIHRQAAEEADAKYQRELVLHAADVEVLEQLRQKHADLVAQQNSHDDRLTELQHKVDQAAVENQRLQTDHAQEVQRLKADNAEFRQQNAQLQEEITQLTQQILNLKRSLDDGSFDQSFQEDIEVSEQLIQINKNLRRQVRLAETNMEVQMSEVARLTHQLASVQRQLEEARENLMEERENSHRQMESAQQHAQMLARVEQMQQLQESNRCLRRDLHEASEAVREAQTKIESLEGSLEPLQLQVSELKELLKTSESEIHSLKEERTRWRERCNQLLSNVERMDPEKYQAVCRENENLQTTLKVKGEVIGNLECERVALQTQLESTQSQIRELNAQIERLQSEKTEFETLVSNHSSELARRDGRYNQLREMARRYLTDANQLRAQLQQKENELASVNETVTSEKVEHQSLLQLLQRFGENVKMLKERHQLSASYQMAELSTSCAVEFVTSLLDYNNGLVAQCEHLLGQQTQRQQDLEQNLEELRSRIHLLESALQKLRQEKSDLQAAAVAHSHVHPVATTAPSLVTAAPVASGFEAASGKVVTSSAPTLPLFPQQQSRIPMTSPVQQQQMGNMPIPSIASVNTVPVTRQFVEIRPMSTAAVATVTPSIAMSEEFSAPSIRSPCVSSVVEPVPVAPLPRSLPHPSTFKRRASTPGSGGTDEPQVVEVSTSSQSKRFCPEVQQQHAVSQSEEEVAPVLVEENVVTEPMFGTEMPQQQLPLLELLDDVEPVSEHLHQEEQPEVEQLDYEEEPHEEEENNQQLQVETVDHRHMEEEDEHNENEDHSSEEDDEEEADDEDEEDYDEEDEDLIDEMEEDSEDSQPEVIEISDSDEDGGKTQENEHEGEEEEDYSSESESDSVKASQEDVSEYPGMESQSAPTMTTTDAQESAPETEHQAEQEEAHLSTAESHVQQQHSQTAPGGQEATRPKITPIVWGSPSTGAPFGLRMPGVAPGGSRPTVLPTAQGHAFRSEMRPQLPRSGGSVPRAQARRGRVSRNVGPGGLGGI